jgi:signal transduction histidine kinase/HAMP domain-containing protein
VTRLLQLLRDVSLRRKVTVMLTVVFALTVAALLLLLGPFLGEQRSRLLEQDKRLLSTLRRTHEREFIYDQLSLNRESLAQHLQVLAAEEGILWVRFEAGAPGLPPPDPSGLRQLDLAATADRRTIRRLIGEEADQYLDRPGVVLIVTHDGEADLVGPNMRPLLAGRQVHREEVGPEPPPAVGQDRFREATFGGQRVLALVSTLAAADQPYGRLHILQSLAPLERSEALTRRIFYGGVAVSFVLVLLLLNLLLSRMVLAPVRRVHDAMARATTGDLSARLPVHSRDEVGSIALAFNRMVEELEASRREIEGYSRNLEAMVEARTAELRASQATLLALKNHLSTVIANVGTGVVSLDEQGRIETFNERAGEILALAPEGARGRTLEQALGESGAARLVDLVAPVQAGRQTRHEAQVVCDLPKGRRTLSVVASALSGEGRRPIGTVVVVDDLTQILASQRLEAWKEAVERVIHEIKNPLTPVGLAAETLKSAWTRDPARFADLFPPAIDMILGAVRDLKELIGEFSRFSRLPMMRAERVDPNALVVEALAPYTQAKAPGLQVKVDLAPDVPAVEADADQLKRVLLNVINNALEAMGERGGQLQLRTVAEDGGVGIRIQDDGPGVDDVERIFEPHYTTKVKGTGLGLAIARQIVEEHGGRIHAESAPGKGTCVHIFLPSAAAAQPALPVVASTPPGRGPRRTP